MKVVHVIADMDVGGAPIMLQRLVQELQFRGVANVIIALGAIDHRFRSLEASGVTMRHLGMRTAFSSVLSVARLRRLIAEAEPDIVHTWMYHADLLGGLVAASAGVRHIVWGLHHTPSDGERLKPLTRLVMALNAWLSASLPSRIVCCADAARVAHAARGYASDKMVLIGNGFDIELFQPDDAAPASVRKELGLRVDAPLIGLMARFHPQKDHYTFVRATARLAAVRPDVHFVLAGRNVNTRNTDLRAWISEAGVSGRLHLLGNRDDIPRLMAACDIVTSSAAVGEAFPLVLGEAMACGVPCVTTAVGDSARIVGDTGEVVPPRSPEALAEAWASLLALPEDERRAIGARARQRVVSMFGLGSCVDQHLELYAGLAVEDGLMATP